MAGVILRPSQPWPLCPGSPQFVARLREEGKIPQTEPDSEVAALGTRCHSYAEYRIKASFYPDNQRGHWQDKADEIGDTLPENYLENASKYIRYVTDVLFGRENSIEWGVETKVKIWYEPNHKGTVDFWYKEGATLYVIDYKSGRVEVDPNNNTQLLSYAIGLWDSRGFRETEVVEVKLGIIQPFVGGFRGHEPYWAKTALTPTDLEYARRELGYLAMEARSPLVRSRLIPGEKQCRFCPAKPLCPAVEEKLRQEMGVMEPVNDLTDKQLFQVLDSAKVFRDYLDSVEDRVRDMPEETLKSNGWRLQRGARKFGWNQTEDMTVSALMSLGLDPYKQVLKTPAMVRDELGSDELLEGLYSTDYNRPTLKRMKS